MRISRKIFGSYVTTLSPRSLSLEKVQQRFKATSLCEHSKKKYQEIQFYLRPEEETYARRIRRVILKANSRTVEDVIQSLQCDEMLSGFQLTSPVVDSLLQKFGDDWKSAFSLFEWASLQISYKHTTYACNKMVDLLGKMRKWERMWDLVEDMREGCSVTLDTIAKMMRRLAGGGKWKDAIVVFDELESFGFVRDTETMNILLDTLCKEKKVEVAREAFVVLKSHIHPDAYTFNIFVHGWCNARRVDEAMWTIQEMKLWRLKPSIITYSTILQAYCNQTNFQKVYELLDLMVSEGCPPNVVTYTTIMNSLAKLGNFDEALGMVDRMKSSGCKPDTLFYNSLINILGRGGQVHEASKVFEVEMEMNGIGRSVSTYNTMISIFCHDGQEQRAFTVLTDMEKASCKPDLQTYRPLLRLCLSKRELYDHIERLLNDIMDKHNLSLDLDTYTLLIHGLCRVGDTEWACLLFDDMLGREILPRYETCKLLMDEARRRNMEANVERIQTVMDQLGSVP
ncbi:pentatricopeptide repeat-containing protein At3g04130, mitochondrial isoform X2 [Ananas comosus]|uniref:Pentatricopeptide repeat-containing protein At3g04130, mitochondrial isoform X2 n=1 Tax=Ananas comosus TaxID=4615 RepID=A0A6P5H1L5_ANACO|nr:pentatricopeptide repeat-containing protein At3g04130, mitochondrial isoform X2 [Ananas comosus]